MGTALRKQYLNMPRGQLTWFDAIDQHGNVMIQPADNLDDPYVVYVVART